MLMHEHEGPIIGDGDVIFTFIEVVIKSLFKIILLLIKVIYLCKDTLMSKLIQRDQIILS